MIAVAVLAPVIARAQDKREEILKKVQAALDKARPDLLKKIQAVIDGEMAPKAPAGDRRQALEKRLADVLSEMRRVEMQLLEARYQSADEKLYDEARKKPMEHDEAREAFTEALAAHNDKKFDDAIPKFKRLVYSFHDSADEGLARLGTSAAYNIACGYALAGKKIEALDWLEITVGRGYLKYDDSCHATKLEHLEADADLDGLREEARYKDLIRRAKSR